MYVIISETATLLSDCNGLGNKK